MDRCAAGWNERLLPWGERHPAELIAEFNRALEEENVRGAIGIDLHGELSSQDGPGPARCIELLFGGLVVIEILFNYKGIGLLLFNATRDKDFPLLASCVMVVGAVYLLFTLLGDLIYSLLNPRFRVEGKA